jgi:signal transduction histidine kinase
MDRTLKRTSVTLALMLMAASVVILLGWQFRVPALKGTVLGSFVAPNTALCFIICGFAILFQHSSRRWIVITANVLAALLLIFSLATLSEWIFKVDHGIDRLFFAHRLSDWTLPFPGRFSVNSGIGFSVAGLCLLTLRARFRLPVSAILATVLLFFSYLSLIGYAYSVPALYSSGNIMALPTGILFTLLAVSLICTGSNQLLDIVLSPYAGGIVSRRMITSIAILMPILGWLEIKGRDIGFVSREVGILLLVFVAVITFSILALQTATILNRVDIQRRKTEAALRSSEEQQAESLQQIRLNLKRLELIEGAVNAGTWEFDVATGISRWPPGISALWGLPPAHHEIPLDQFSASIHPDDRERVTNVIQLGSLDFYDVEFRVVWPDQTVHWLGARGAVLRNETGAPTKVIGIALEVTERHQTEKALRDSEKLAATGRLAATIAHEINNPLEAVVNLVYLTKTDSRLAPDLRDLLESADIELARVGHMVRQTLGFYRESLNPVWTDVSEMVEQVISLYRNKMQRKNVKLKVRIAPAKVYALEGELRQVVSNLLSNAIDAVEIDGTINIRVRQTQTGVRIMVADNGEGIAPNHRGKLFQPFFTTKKDVGTGLGLWVSKGIIDKHHGRVRVRTNTRPGYSGTVFSVELPLEAVGAAAQTAALVG